MTVAQSLAWLVVVLNLVAAAAVVSHKLRPLSWGWMEPFAIYGFAAQNFAAVAALVALAFHR